MKNITYMVLIPVLLITLLVIYFIGKNSGKAKALAEGTNTLENEIDNKALRDSRDMYQQRNAELIRQVKSLSKKK